MTIRRFVIITVTMTFLLSAGFWLWQQLLPETPITAAAPDEPRRLKSDIDTKETSVRFPTATGSNLQRSKLTLPADFGGELNITLIAFEQWQQNTVNTWLPFVEQLEQRYDGVRYYELPVIRRMNFFARTFINEGMRAGIPNAKARDRTITLYLDKQAFRQALDLPHERDIYVLVLDRAGNVVWRTESAFTPEKGEALTRAVEAYQGPNNSNTIDQLSLDDYRWQNRLLLVFAPSSTDKVYTEQMRNLARYQAESEERDLLVFSLFKQEPGRLIDRPISVNAAGDARASFDLDSDSFAVLLIGKDGGVKLQSRQPVAPADIFDLIDTMPMRQREMQAQSK